MKKIEKYVRSDKGSITTVILVTVLFFVTILSAAYMVTASLRKGQLRSELVAKQAYEDDFNHIEEITESLTTKIVDGVTLPRGFYYVGGTKDSGLVISDSKVDEDKYKDTNSVGTDLQGNQYVWIEVPKTGEVYQIATIYIVEGENGRFTDAEYIAIENDLRAYTETYRKGTTFKDEYYSDTALNSSQYMELKKKMLQSVYKNGGFWIGRYETGIKENVIRNYGTDNSTEHPINRQTPVVQANRYPYNWVRCSQAQTLASSVNSGNCTSSLVFGLQWDLTLKYLETKGTSSFSLTKNSTNLGNYMNSLYNVKNTNEKYSTDNGTTWNNVPYQKIISENILLTTGANIKINSKQNIYDLAGNVWEWTLENAFVSENPAVSRGGCYHDDDNYPVNQRSNGPTNYSSYDLGFRITLY